MRCIVNEGGVIDNGTSIFQPGESVELDGREADRLLERGRVREVQPALNVVVALDDVVHAIEGMDTTKPDLWTSDNRPTVEALSSALGKKITSRHRDAGWEIYLQERGAS